MRTFLKYIGYILISTVMWIGWLPYIVFRTGFYSMYMKCRQVYGPAESFTFAFRYVKGLLANNAGRIIPPIVFSLILYFIILAVLYYVRRLLFWDVMDEEDLNNFKVDRKIKKQEAKDRKLLARQLFFKYNIPEEEYQEPFSD